MNLKGLKIVKKITLRINQLMNLTFLEIIKKGLFISLIDVGLRMKSKAKLNLYVLRKKNL